MDIPDERQSFERFSGMVLADRALLDQLRATPDENAFVALAIHLGAERGCAFTAPAVTAAIRERRRAWRERWL